MPAAGIRASSPVVPRWTLTAVVAAAAAVPVGAMLFEPQSPAFVCLGAPALDLGESTEPDGFPRAMLTDLHAAPCVSVELTVPAAIPAGDDDGALVLATVRGLSTCAEPERPVDLALALQIPGNAGPARTAALRDATVALVDALGPEDRLAIAAFGGPVRMLSPIDAPRETVRALAGLLGAAPAELAAPDGALGDSLLAGLLAAADTVPEPRGRYPLVVLVGAGAPGPDGLDPVDLGASLAIRAPTVSAVGFGRAPDARVLRLVATSGDGRYTDAGDAPSANAGARDSGAPDSVASGAGGSTLTTALLGELARAHAVVARHGLVYLRVQGGTLGDVYGAVVRQEPTLATVRLGDLAEGDERRVLFRVRADGGGGEEGGEVRVTAAPSGWTVAGRSRVGAYTETAVPVRRGPVPADAWPVALVEAAAALDADGQPASDPRTPPAADPSPSPPGAPTTR